MSNDVVLSSHFHYTIALFELCLLNIPFAINVMRIIPVWTRFLTFDLFSSRKVGSTVIEAIVTLVLAIPMQNIQLHTFLKKFENLIGF
jgi:hypothetical protein